MRYLRPRGTVPFQTSITFRGRDLICHAEILPARDSRHVSYDHPDRWRPARKAEVVTFALYREPGDIDLVNHYRYYRHEIEAAILREWVIDQAAARMMERKVI